MLRYHDNMTPEQEKAFLDQEKALDDAYAQAAEADEKGHDEWVRKNFEVLTRRTDYPKLGYIIHCLNENGIACIVHGESAHAPILWVEVGEYNNAFNLTISNTELDEKPDDHPDFEQYMDTSPDTDFYN